MPKTNTIVVTPSSLNSGQQLPITSQGFNGKKVEIGKAIKNPATVQTNLRSGYAPKKA